MTAAEQYAYMTVSECLYPHFRHWLKRHGWLLMYRDSPYRTLVFCSIKPVYAGLQLDAQFTAPGKCGVKFDGYVIL
jgi:hypothetical protein